MSSREVQKEVIDIIPPKNFKKSSESFPRKKNRIFISKFRFDQGKALSLVGVLFVILIFYSFIATEARVRIIPKMEEFSSELTIIVDREVRKADVFSNTIPGYLLEETNSLSKSFSSSGKIVAAKKAEGVIRVYNDYSAFAQPFRARTRFMSASGKVFRTPTRIVVPGKRIENKKQVPGYIDVRVIADQPGEEYNIEPTTFSIPGLVGTPLYTKFYGKSFEPMKGGFKGEISQITEEDIKKAQDLVIKTLKTEGKKVIEKKALDSDAILLREALVQKIQATSSPEPGTQVDRFEFRAEAKSIALVFKNKDIKKLIANQIPEGRKIDNESLEFHWEPQRIDLDSGKMIINLKFSGNIYSNIDLSNIKKEIIGRKIPEVKEILEKRKEISRADIIVRPFWRKSLPFSQTKVEIELDLTQEVD